MIKCRTKLDNKTIKALTKYHMTKKEKHKRKKVMTYFFGIILLILSIINAYGYWLKYYGKEPVLTILLKSSVFVILSSIILITSIKGAQHNLYRELKQYFMQTNAKYIDYIISNNGIRLTINDNSTMYEWIVIEHIESDTAFYYFSSQGKHSIISKKSMSSKDITMFDNLIKKKKEKSSEK